MSDPRFFENSGPFSLIDINNLIKGELSCDNENTLITDISTLKFAGNSEITFFQDPAYKSDLSKTKASVCLIKKEHKGLAPSNLNLIFSENPYMDFTLISQSFYPNEILPKSTSAYDKSKSSDGIEHSAAVDSSATIEEGAVIGSQAIIGKNSTVSSNAVIGKGVQIGSNCFIGANVSITHSIIGDGNIIHQGSSIGQDGFGFAMSPLGHKKIPQVGRVLIQDDIEIGANCSIDRGSIQDTIIKKGTKIDNMVHIAHNCIIGENCIIAGMVGLAGSTTLEDFVVMGAKSGAVGHITIGMGSQIAAKAGVSKTLPPGKKWAGFPIREMDLWKKDLSQIRKLSKGKKNDK
jgi:UDP-3-O-[3-hydroxymyristoyl] glucosamine N-acyltransferase